MCVGFGSSKPKPPKCLHQLGANRPRKPTLGWKTTGPLPTPVQYREILSRTCDPERDAPVRLSTTLNSKKRTCCKERSSWQKERLWSIWKRSAVPGYRSVGKGGVGKSLVASILAQYFRGRGRSIQCIETDPVNRTFAQYSGIDATRLELMRDRSIDVRGFDGLMSAC